MFVCNAKIENTPNVISNGKGDLCIPIKFATASKAFNYTFNLQNPIDVVFISTMIQYVGVSELKKLKGRIVRIVISDNGKLIMIGDPIASKFFSLNSNEFKEISEEEIKEILVASDTDF